MAWTPNPNEPSAVFDLPILENALAIIVRDFKGALDYYYPDDDLPDFAELSLGQIQGNEFPCLALLSQSNVTDDAEDDSHIVEAARLDIYMGVTDSDANSVTRKIMKYVRTMNAVLRSARQDFFTGMSNPFGVFLEITHSYGPVGGPTNSILFRGAMIELTINLRER
jgi:hypothetical protein